MRQWRIEPVQFSPVRHFLRTYLISPAFFDKFSKMGGADQGWRHQRRLGDFSFSDA